MTPNRLTLPTSSLWRVLIALVTFTLLAVSFAAPVAAAKGGNSANAKLCQKGGWEDVVRANQTSFANEAECVSHGAMGGTYATPAPVLTISPTSWDAGTIFAFGSPQTATQTFIVTNVGAASTGSLTVGGLNFGRWSTSNDSCAGSSLSAGDTCSFDLTVTSQLVGGIFCGSGAFVSATGWISDPTHVFPGNDYLRLSVQAACG